MQVWKARLASLTSHFIGDDDPRMRQCRAALSYWRLKRVCDAQVTAGHLSQALADWFLDQVKFHDTPSPVTELVQPTAEAVAL